MATDTPSMQEELATLRDLYRREGDCFAGARGKGNGIEIGSFGKLPISGSIFCVVNEEGQWRIEG